MRKQKLVEGKYKKQKKKNRGGQEAKDQISPRQPMAVPHCSPHVYITRDFLSLSS